MSRWGTLTQGWGDGDYNFRLAYGELLQLEHACDAGPDWIARRLRTDEWRPKDVRETIRLGLIGGGMPQGQALETVRKFVETVTDERTWDENRLLAFAIIQYSLRQPKDNEIKKDKGARKTKANASQEERQTSSDSSRSPPLS